MTSLLYLVVMLPKYGRMKDLLSRDLESMTISRKTHRKGLFKLQTGGVKKWKVKLSAVSNFGVLRWAWNCWFIFSTFKLLGLFGNPFNWRLKNVTSLVIESSVILVLLLSLKRKT